MEKKSNTSMRPALSGQGAGRTVGSFHRPSGTELDSLMQALEVELFALREVLVPRGYRVEMGKVEAPGIHFNLRGAGRMSIDGRPPIDLSPHMLVILPPNTTLTIEVDGAEFPPESISEDCWTREGDISRLAVAGEKPEIVQICGFFGASMGQSMQLFSDLHEPVVEQFEPADRIDHKLREAMDELSRREVGAAAMTSSLLRQVLIALFRRSLRSTGRWTERFALIGDKQVARAFADMVARPGASHSINSLARNAGLSRSAFMARFSSVFGRSPMVVLRDLRMRQAASELAGTTLTVDVMIVSRRVV